MAGDCQSLINTLTAVQDTALADAPRESDWCEDGTLGESCTGRRGSCRRRRPRRSGARRVARAVPASGSSWRCAWRSPRPFPPTVAPLLPTRNELGGSHRDRRGPARPYRASVIADELALAPAEVAAGDRGRPRRPPAPTMIPPAPPHPSAVWPHLPADAPTCPAGADLDRAASLGLGAGRKDTVVDISRARTRGRLGRDRPARARTWSPSARARPSSKAARHSPTSRRPGRHHRRAGRACRTGRRAASGDASRPRTGADPRCVRRPQRRPAGVAFGAGAKRVPRPSSNGIRPADGRDGTWCGAGSPTSDRAGPSGLDPRPPSRPRQQPRGAARREKARPRIVPCGPVTLARPRPRWPPRDRRLPTGPAPAALGGSATRRPVPPRGGGSPLLRPRPRAAWPTGPTAATTCSPCRHLIPHQAAPGLAGAPCTRR